jgi:hypothetical protein
MSFNEDQNEPTIPLSNTENRETANLLPKFYRTKDNKKFLQGTLDQLTKPGTVKKVFGYIGRESAKATTSDDIFLEAASKDRQNYQLEPAAVVKDLLGNTTFFKDYIDHISHVSTFDGNVDNHSRINRQEFYSWNPQIDWDKFVNFRQYYWMPFGPDVIEIFGQQQAIISEYTVKSVDEEDNVAYIFTPNGLTRNPTFRLFRGQTYVFDIDTPGHPFSIKTKRIDSFFDRYYDGVEGFAVEKGKITFTVPETAPDVLYYVSENAVDTGGVFHILNIEENTFLDVEQDVIGKKNYTVVYGLAEGLKISNGMKLEFGGQVVPEKYANGYWYIEGVGSAIRLVSEKDVEIRSTYTEEKNLFFDDLPFDQLPYSDTASYPSRPDYITINRSSIDNNPWSRYNRWFHQDVLEVSAKINGKTVELNQSARATRPIIEFLPNIKLYNYGVESKTGIDVIDNFTKDAFSTVEGQLGYNVDGVDLADGMRIIFNAETDVLVKNKIYKVNFIEVQIPSREIEFSPENDIRLETSTIVFSTEHALNTGNRVIYLQNGFTVIPGLQNRQTYWVKTIDPLTIALYKDKNLTKQVEIFGLSNGTQKFELFLGRRRQIQLTEEPNAVPEKFNCVSVKYGINENLKNGLTGNQAQNYWFDGNTWQLCQTKLDVNQPPLFDLFDEEGVSYSDLLMYEGSNFTGTKIFSYKVGSGFNDSALGFPLSYKNINNVGDIVFEFNLLNDEFSFKENLAIKSLKTDIGYLKKSKSLTDYKFENGWITSNITNSQPIVRVYKESGLVNAFPIDVFDNKDDLLDLEVKVYINGKRLNKDQYVIAENVINKLLVLENNANLTDVITLKCFSKQKKNSNGHYEIPINLQNNPLNDNMTEFTLGQVIDHVDSIIDNINIFIGTFPGNNNLRDLGELSSYGTKFVQHSGPLNLPLYHFGNKSANIIKALDKARNDYGQFKRAFLIAADNSGIDLDPKRHVDYVLQEMSRNYISTKAYYLSDMFAFSANNKIEIPVLDSRIKLYPLTNKFSLTTNSNKAIYIYLNGTQLIHGKDYQFGDNEFFEVHANIFENDVLEVYEYENTDGCFCPPTPTKLGLYPKFEPKIYVDDSYAEPTTVIQGHDGSITLAYNDYRDELILELEKRIFNNIKTNYDQTIFHIYNYIPGANRVKDYTVAEFNEILSKYFFQWTQNIPQDYTKHVFYDFNNKFTWNYRGNSLVDGTPVPAAWRGIYRWLFDTDTPHLTPWECLGFSVEPKWWKDIYGPAPYTSDNFILWEDLRDGRIREPGRPVRIDNNFIRPILNLHKPVDQNGKLLSPYDAQIATRQYEVGDNGFFVFGDEYVVESAWRRSSYYPFAILQTLLLMHPAEVFGRCFDRSRIVKNLAGQVVYAETTLRTRLKDVKIPSTYNFNTENRTYASGLINYVVSYLTSEKNDRLDQYKYDLINLTNNISTKLGGFTSKEKFKLILDSKNPNSSGGVFIPVENYFVDLNVSSAIKKVVYSGIIITKFADGFELRGYNFDNPYFNYYGFRLNDRTIRVGGISESFTKWESGKTYVAGKIVQNNNQYYRTKITHISTDEFNNDYFAKLPSLPIVGGREVILRKAWDKDNVQKIAYGTKLSTIQDVADVIQGYGEYLTDQGFVFDDYNSNLSAIANWETSVKEFLFWTTQGWAEGSVISISPSANRIVFNSDVYAVESLLDDFYGYNVYRVDGQKLNPDLIDVYRGNGQFILEPKNTNFGVYGLTLYLVQKEHVIVLDDTTLFNDTIYDKPAGYRQEKIKALGYITSNWKGGFEIPGFIYDRAVVKEWTPWSDYNLGDIVKYKEFYYSAEKFLPGAETFDDEDWILLESKPKSELLPNWDYRTEQFTDFYDLDTDNFDVEQQKLAQHLTGYQKRQYLENIINNDVSQYKFYQGMITEKGTLNSLTKLFDVLSADGQESLTFDEEWAFRVGEYGALDTFNEIEFVLDEKNFKITPQPLEIVDSIDVNVVDYIYKQLVEDVYIKPEPFNKDVWKQTQNKAFLRSAGYVRKETVKSNVDKISSLTAVDISDFIEGDYVWAAFEGVSWNVYRFTKSVYKIQNVSYDSSTKIATIECNSVVNYTPGQVIGIENSSKLKGFHVITDVVANKIKFTKTLTGFSNFEDKNTILLYILIPQRVANIDDVNNILNYQIKDNEILWADNSGDDKWAVYRNNPVYTRSTVPNSNPTNNLNFGSGIAISKFENAAVVADNNNLVSLYLKASTDNNWQVAQRFFKPLKTLANVSMTVNDWGAVMAFSNDGKFLAIASPNTTYTLSNQGVVRLFGKSSTGQYVLVEEFFGQFAGEQFGSNIVFGVDNNTYVLAISSNNRVRVYRNQNLTDFVLINTFTGDDNFGYDITVSDKDLVLAISEPNDNSNQGRVYVYNYNLTYSLNQELTITVAKDSLVNFGQSISLSQTANYLAISATLANTRDLIDVGSVYVYKKTSTGYVIDQIINSRNKETNEQFGYHVNFMNDDKSIVISSKYSDVKTITTFDSTTTIFDNNSVKFIDKYLDIGSIDIYDRYNTKFIYGETLKSVVFLNTDYGKQIAVGRNCVLVSANKDEDNGKIDSGMVYSYVKPAGTYSWNIIDQQEYKIDISTIKKAFIYDKTTNQILKYLDVVDPTQGKIPGIAEQEIKFKTYFDPATYSVGNSAVIVDDGNAWTDNYVGMLWWNLTNAKFLDIENKDLIYKSSAWNKLYDTASIDVYEWVKSKYTPEQWLAKIGTTEGIAEGVEGALKHDISVYSVKKRYDNVSKTFKNIYYFWVKNRTIIPNIEGRKLSAFNVARLIADPASYGYSCIAFLGTSSVNLVNLEKYLTNSNVVLSIQYWTNEDRQNNYHSQWKILSTNRNTVIPSILEDKWFHSLIGKDGQSRVVPDIKLPLKQRYGIEYRPRQGMFVNRIEALKQFIERTNTVLKNVLIADTYNLSNLKKFESAPSKISGKWDIQIDSDSELRFISTFLIKTAILSPVIVDSKIIRVDIIDPGFGYGLLNVVPKISLSDPDLWYGPELTVSGIGHGAELRSIVNNLGQVVRVDVNNPGENYTDLTSILARNFTVLVDLDQDSNSWALYEWSTNSNIWNRSKVQSYNVNNYWVYNDWYSDGYNEFTKIDYLYNNTYELITSESQVGDVIKIKNVGSGGWMLLEKYNNVATIDYTENYKVVGREKGTIRFLSNIYSPIKGYDKFLLDSVGYDIYPIEDLKIILNSIKNDLFVDELKVEYLRLFFSSIRYALHEQTYLDWAMKTSFVKAMHNLGDLKQKITYNSDNLEFFEQYINEVKPYKTKIREYVSNYSKVDPSRTAITDFDLLPIITESLTVLPLDVKLDSSGEIITDKDEIDQYPWAFWAENIGFEIVELRIFDQGSGYKVPPVLEITGQQIEGGLPAQAKAYISKGKVVRIELISGGTKWISAPTVVVKGSTLEGGSPARVIAIIGNSPIRTNYINVKFDRTSRSYQVNSLEETETFSGSIVSGSRTQFSLRWSPNIEFDKYSVRINDIEVLKNEYSIKEIKKLIDGNTRYSGLLTFVEPPEAGSVITITYRKNFKHLNAVDRINFFYNPQTGQLGKDLGLLMTGIDYGGVAITGLGFENAYGWDSTAWFSENWDAVPADFDDFIVEVRDPINYSFRLPYIPAQGQVINIYVSKFDPTTEKYLQNVRIDDINYLTILQTNANAVMTSFTGDGEVDIIVLPPAANLETYTVGSISYGDKVIFRKINSDGSLPVRDENYDTKLSGGNLAYSTATGIAPDDIILDGDGLITPMTSHAPEEIVPGQVMDTLAIKVYSRPTGGCPNILFKTYKGDGANKNFTIGQYFPNNNSIIVKVLENVVLLDVDYTINWETNQVEFLTAPDAGADVSIISISFNSSTLLDVDYFVGDGITKEFITKAPWVINLNATVLVNGNVQPYELFSANAEYTESLDQSWRSRVGIVFGFPPPAGSIINYMVDTIDTVQTASIVKSEIINFVPGTLEYSLANPIGVSYPLDANVLVKYNNTVILQSPSYEYFTLENNQLTYELKDSKYQTLSLDAEDILVYLDNNLLTFGIDYSIEINYSQPLYSLDTTEFSVIGGAGYVVGDILEVQGGTSTGNITKFEVVIVNGSTGAVLAVELIDAGSYTEIPNDPLVLTGGTGSGVNISGTYVKTQDLSNYTIVLDNTTYNQDSKLTIEVLKGNDYRFTDSNNITFTEDFGIPIPIEIISFYNHNVLGIERTVDTFNQTPILDTSSLEYYEFNAKSGGMFKLNSTVPSGNFVWVIKNGELLINDLDYYLENDFQTVRLKEYQGTDDVIQLIAFTNSVVQDQFGYMIFKDIMNRVHYKRLNKEKSTILQVGLGQFDNEIIVQDPTVLDDPQPNVNIPGIIEINGERIEYFVKDGYSLKQLRRGTLGTGIPETHTSGSVVQSIGYSETIPYKDEYVIEKYISDGVSNLVPLTFTPSKDDIEVFVGGFRLKKNEYKLYSNLSYPYSPEGDITLDPEFTITGSGTLQLSSVPVAGTRIVVVKKYGKIWNDLGKRLANSNNRIANFIKEVEAVWPETTLRPL